MNKLFTFIAKHKFFFGGLSIFIVLLFFDMINLLTNFNVNLQNFSVGNIQWNFWEILSNLIFPAIIFYALDRTVIKNEKLKLLSQNWAVTTILESNKKNANYIYQIADVFLKKVAFKKIGTAKIKITLPHYEQLRSSREILKQNNENTIKILSDGYIEEKNVLKLNELILNSNYLLIESLNEILNNVTDDTITLNLKENEPHYIITLFEHVKLLSNSMK